MEAIEDTATSGYYKVLLSTVSVPSPR